MSDQASIKAMIRRMVQAVGGPKQSAFTCKVSETEISLWGSDNTTRYIPIDHLVDLDAEAGDMFLEYWAQSRGYGLVELKSKPNQAASVLKTIAQFSRHAGNLDCATVEAAEDGTLSPNEKRTIRDRIAPVENMIGQLKAVLA